MRANRRSIVAAATAFTGEVVPGHELQTAGLAYEAIKTPNLFEYDGQTIKGIDFQIVRKDTRQSIGCVGAKYEILQNADVFGPVIEIARQNGATYDGGGTVFGGQTAWMSFRLPFEISVPGRPDDKMDTNIIVFNSFTGKTHAFISTFVTRWFCMNQMRAIRLHHKETKKVAPQLVHKIKHNRRGPERLKTAQDAFGAAVAEAQQTAEVFGILQSQPMNRDQMRDFVEQLFPSKDEDVPTRLENKREQVISLFSRGEGNKGATRADAINALTEYLNHYSTTKNTTGKSASENRLASVLMPDGSADKVIMEGVNLLMQ